MLSLRIVSVDTYIAPPVSGLDPTYSHFRNSVVHQVPVIRVFGITPKGEKGCLHIHGVFPYFYIPVKEDGIENIDGFMYKLSESLDKQLNLICNSKYNKQNVFKITLVKGKPIYGYHTQNFDFLKIYFYKPSYIKKAATILQDGLILGQSFQPHEAHIPYILQFFIDYNLYGMSYLDIEKFTYRIDGDDNVISKKLKKVSNCLIEVDGIADNILNISQTSGSTMSNPGLVHIWNEERERRRNEDLSSDPSLQHYDNLSGTYRSDNELEQISLLRKALKERIQLKLESNRDCINDSIALDASFRESHSSAEILAEQLLDSQDLLLLEAFKKNVDYEECNQDFVPDQDSILGSQKQPAEENSISDDENPELTRPFRVSESENSESEDELDVTIIESPDYSKSTSNRVNIFCNEASFNSNEVEHNGSPIKSKQITPKKVTRKSNPTTPNRYKPLEITITKSPRSFGDRTSGNDSVDSSPKSSTFFEKFHLNATLTHLKRKLNQSSCEIENIDSTIKDSKNTINHQSSSTSDEPNVSSFIHNRTARKALNFTDSHILNINENEKEVIQCSTNSNDENNFSIRNKFGNDLEMSKDGNALTPCLSNNTLFDLNFESKCYLTLLEPPSKQQIINFVKTLSYPLNSNKSLFYGDPKDDDLSIKDVGVKTVPYALYKNLEEFKGFLNNNINENQNKNLNVQHLRRNNKTVVLYPVNVPPSFAQAQAWLETFNAGRKRTSCSSKPIELEEDIIQSSDENNIYEFSGSTINEHHKHSLTLSNDFLTSESSSSDKDNKNVNSANKNEDVLPQPSPLLSKKSNSCLIENATPDEKIFHKEENKLPTNYLSSLHKYITLFAMELHTQTRGSFNPDPEHDQITALFYCITNDVPEDCEIDKKILGVIMVSPGTEYIWINFLDCKVTIVSTEIELLNKLVEILHIHDPDILCGYEIEMLSWSYLIQRGTILGLNLFSSLSRIKEVPNFEENLNLVNNERFQLKIPGRILLNVWRLMRYEIALMSYSFENVVYNILHRRVPRYSFKTLTYWWNNSFSDRMCTLKYYLMRVEGTVKLLEELDFVGRTSELATLFGIQFYEVLSRGSQFRVESIMFRMAKPNNYVAVSPSIHQRAAMRAPSFLPLIMEPQSRFFEDPVIVLDFQSLYPSMIIAYNYCFSTCLGLLQNLLEKDEITFGCTSLLINPKEAYRTKESLHISPSGAVFVDSSIRRGILPQMLEEILETRLMVKNSMKRHKNNKVLYQILDARQLGLKLIANVTYGYTSANFSGRMPCVEVGDSVVSKGRETLERAIKLVERTKRWGAEVVYGDTDSLFVLCRGKSRKEAFEVGQEIADAVTLDNPKPVKLKLEKVYQPCILQTKKRYAGYMYESSDQEKPVYDAKGIETVRRDGCPAASKILEKSLKILFESYDVSKVKAYVSQQLNKIISGKLYFQDLIFAKEFRGLHGYKPSACVPALKLAKEWIAKDKRSEPRVGERVGYVIICGAPGLPLIQLVRSPHELLMNSSLKINTEYYITKAILPPLDRCFSLMGVNVFSWYRCLPKKRHLKKNLQGDVGLKRATLSQYFLMENCIVCNEITTSSVCVKCQGSTQLLCTAFLNKIGAYERRYNILMQVCGCCSGRTVENDCISLDCPIFYSRIQAVKNFQDVPSLRNILEDNLPC